MFYRPQAYILCVPALVMVASCSTTSSVPVGATVTRQGTFVSAEHPTSGSVKLFTKDNQNFIEFGSDFRTDQGPDLFVILHRAPNILAVTTPPTFSIKEGEYVVVAPIKSVTGSQTYSIDGNINLQDFQSVAIWCKQFNATFGTASLAP